MKASLSLVDTGSPADRREPVARATSDARTEWADIAKAISILLIVVAHAAVDVASVGADSTVMSGFRTMLTPVRIPMFFLISGIFAAKIFTGPTQRLFDRVADLFKVYVLWGVITHAFRITFFEQYYEANALTGHEGLLIELLLPTPFPWFLWALALFNIMAGVGTRYAPRTTLAVAVAFKVGIDLIPYDLPGTHTVGGVGFYSNFLFFVLPFYFPAIREQIERLPALRTASLGGMAYCGILFIENSFVGQWIHPILSVTATAVGITALLCIARMMEANRPIKALMVKVGQKTLPIYVIHSMISMSLALMASTLGLYGNAAVNVLIILAITALSVATSMYAERIMPKAMRDLLFIPRRPRAA